MKKQNVAMLNAKAEASGISQMPAYNNDPHAFFQEWIAEDDSFFNIVDTYWARRSQENLLLVHYNDLKQDLDAETRRIADFLNIQVTEDELGGVLERCSFEYMRNHPEMVGDFERMFEGGAKGFLFKGTNGRWRDVLTKDELAQYDERASERLSVEALTWLEHGRHQ